MTRLSPDVRGHLLLNPDYPVQASCTVTMRSAYATVADPVGLKVVNIRGRERRAACI